MSNKKKYDEELTVSLKLKGKEVSSVRQGKKELTFTLKGTSLLVNVMPFGKKVRVKFK